MAAAQAQEKRHLPPNHRRSMLDQEVDPNKFDTRTHLFDNQGRLVKKNLYTLYIVDGEQFYERPVASGNLWYPNNLPAGRVIRENGKKVFDHSAEHIDFVPALEGHEAVEFELYQEKAKNKALENEIAHIKADFEARLAKLEGSNSIQGVAVQGQQAVAGSGQGLAAMIPPEPVPEAKPERAAKAAPAAPRLKAD